METNDVLVIGGGQAGLATGWHLRREGLAFRILEAEALPGGAWPRYYDSLQLFSPASYSSLPGKPFPGDPDRYPLRDEVTAYLRSYAAELALPVIPNTKVVEVVHDGSFNVRSQDGRVFTSHALVVASGAFNTPHIPSLPGQEAFEGQRLHSAAYGNPGGFQGQRVIVVGGANSAVQIAYELAKTARVTLATRRAIRYVPQRLFGLDFHFWMKATGLDFLNILDDQSTPVLDDGRYRAAIRSGSPDARPMFSSFWSGGVVWPDGTREQVDTVIFATGFRPNVPYLSGLDALDAQGRPLQRKGISAKVPGLFFVGMPRQRNFASATLRGVGPDAAYVMPHLVRHLRAVRPKAQGWRSEIYADGLQSS